jgi:RHH-type transcriptional regulator, proline utilization regulon repressor / proline dehydrogenase / delta 1-pyrroline-5-carboxylate dehydrogenase
MILTTLSLACNNPYRRAIAETYHMDETECINYLLPMATLAPEQLSHLQTVASELLITTREYQKRIGKIEALLQQYDLSSEEGIALMCLAEALLRIPDNETRDRLISDKLTNANWRSHLNRQNTLFVNAATWSLLISSKIYGQSTAGQASLMSALSRTIARVGASMIRPIILKMMAIIGQQFVLGQTIAEATKRAQSLENMGYRFSYDMLGEAARTSEDVEHYFNAYKNAIEHLGSIAKDTNPANNPGISIKLSALHPRYEYAKAQRVLAELVPRLLILAEAAKKYHLGFTIDAEEADRLELSLDIIEAVFTSTTLHDWDGFGMAVQAYQKRASFVIDWIVSLTRQQQRKMMVRLVKGAYWDSEIKLAQTEGFDNYAVFTRKNTTDVSYLACAHKMLEHSEMIYPQFGSHNIYTVAAIMEMVKPDQAFEFQCLHGMGRPLYDQIVDKTKFNIPCRIYAPVGTHKDLLAYLVRRLLENGANTSFVHHLRDANSTVESILYDPVLRIAELYSKPHPKIPAPRDIYQHWQSAKGIDLSSPQELMQLKTAMEKIEQQHWQAGPIINGKTLLEQNRKVIYNPAVLDQSIGEAFFAGEDDVLAAIASANEAKLSWAATSVASRAAILEKAADLFEQAMPMFINLLCKEAGKCIPDCLSEIRETIDYCRYYAYRVRIDLTPITLPGPTGEMNQLSLHPRGIIACISPWNFPLAIFCGQIIAALVVGNTVVAKPAEQTPLVAYYAIKLLHQAGIPENVLQFLPGSGETVGATLVSDKRIAGVMFTGGTATARIINQSLANRKTGPIPLLVAETGGQNAMICDSSILPEQTTLDIVKSAFNSAGQRCSALRVLFVQEEVVDELLAMLKGYMAELTIGDPSLLATDIGPVIDSEALHMLKNHFANMTEKAKLIAQVPLAAGNGYYFAPAVFELNDLSILTEEKFGPILHVIRYKASQLDQVLNAIIDTGYGLTLGIQSRIEATIDYIAAKMPVGNRYVNRNMVGAVVGVQPFGGEGLSGTGPKAGGPHYLPHLCIERTLTINTTAIGGNARLVSLIEDD